MIAPMPTCHQCSAPLPEGARFCPICAAPVEREPATRERKLATVLFADLVGSTALGGSMDPEQSRDMLDRFYDAMAAEIALGGGTVEKFIGDAVVAVFGAPTAQEDHAERALQVGLWMITRLAELFGQQLALRIGVNTGEVVVGRPHEGSSFVTGDAVNMAARLEQGARPGQVLVGERTAGLVGGAFEFDEPMSIEAKGKPSGVPCRRLIRMVVARRPRGGRGLETAFVGRERELASLHTKLHRSVEEGRPRLVTLVGEAGVGKTSVLSEFRSRLPQDVRFQLGRCLSYGRGVTFSPLAEVLRSELELREEDPPEAALARLSGREILALTLGLDVAGELDPRAAGQRLQEEWVSLLDGLVTDGPLVLAVEDLHWAAQPLLELLDRVLNEVAGPLLLLVTARPGGPRLRAAGESVNLEPLSEQEANEMLQRVLGGPLLASARDLVIGHAEGNPFFLEEVLAELIDRRLLERRNGGWILRDGERGLGIPDSVQGVLAGRIDLLTSPAKTALQAAAVVGRSFSPAALASLVGSAAEVRTLVERGFIRASEPELVFKHALTREVAYGSLPKAERARLHASYADWLEEQEEGDARAGTLAYHYAEAVNPEIAELAWRDRADEAERLRANALDWLRRAADLALGRFDLEDALALLHRAADLAPEDGGIWHEIGRVNSLKFDGEAYWESMLKAIELTSEPEPLAELYGELAFESTMRGAMWKREPGDELLLAWIDKGLELAAPDGRAFAYASLGKAMMEDDVPATERAISIAERLDDLELLSFGLFTRFGIALVSFHYASAYDWAQKRLALEDRFTDPDHLALIHWGSSTAELGLGHLDRASAHAQRHDAIGVRLSPHHAVHALGNLLIVEEAAGRWDRVRDMQERVERAVVDNVDTPCVLNARCLLSCAVASAELGLEAEARRLEDATQALGMEGYELWLDPERARLALIRSDLDTLGGTIEGSERWLWVTYAHVNNAVVRLDALIALGRLEEAEEQATQLLQPGTYLEPFALRTLGVVRRNPDLIAQAEERFEALGLNWHAAQDPRHWS
jgi:class 3 adenylate cyclase/tetratricopeptide (TPR) repeat protein